MGSTQKNVGWTHFLGWTLHFLMPNYWSWKGVLFIKVELNEWNVCAECLPRKIDVMPLWMYTKTQLIIFTDMLVQSNKMLVQFNRMLVQLKQIFKLDGLNPFNFSALAPWGWLNFPTLPHWIQTQQHQNHHMNKNYKHWNILFFTI